MLPHARARLWCCLPGFAAARFFSTLLVEVCGSQLRLCLSWIWGPWWRRYFVTIPNSVKPMSMPSSALCGTLFLFKFKLCARQQSRQQLPVWNECAAVGLLCLSGVLVTLLRCYGRHAIIPPSLSSELLYDAMNKPLALVLCFLVVSLSSFTKYKNMQQNLHCIKNFIRKW